MLIWILIILCVITNAFYFGFAYARRIENDLELPIADKQHLYCIGDGLTYGVGVLRERRAFAWPYLLNVALGAQWQVLNYGVSNAVVCETSKSCITKCRAFERYMQQTEKTVLVMIGSNDSKLGEWHEMRFEEDYSALLRRILETSNRCIVLLPPAVHAPRDGRKTDIRAEIVEQIVEIERKCADHLNLSVFDLHTLSKNHKEWYCDDGVHLNRAGNQAVADALTPVICV